MPTSSGAFRPVSRSCRAFASTSSSPSRATAPGATSQVSTIVPAFDPRLSARVTLTDSVAWLSTFGLSHQYPALARRIDPAAGGLGPRVPVRRLPGADGRAGEPGRRGRAARGLHGDAHRVSVGLVGAYRLDRQLRPALAAERALPVPRRSARARAGVRARAPRPAAAFEASDRLALVHAISLDPRDALPHPVGGRRRRRRSWATTIGPTCST